MSSPEHRGGMTTLYTYEVAALSGDRWSTSWHRMCPEERNPQEIARSVLERWIVGRTTPLPAGRVVVRGGRHANDSPPERTVVRVRVYDHGTAGRVIAPAAVAYLTAFHDSGARVA